RDTFFSSIAGATVKEDYVMKTMWQSHGKMSTCLLLLLISLLLHKKATSGIRILESINETPICTYQETRKHVPINPKTHKPYTAEEQNQEPFIKPSISKAQIKGCLRGQKPIHNHHILFEDYRDAWQELAQETKNYAIPFWIRGGVLHAEIQNKYDKTT